MSILMPVLITLHVIVCLFLVLVVLMQRPRSEGLGSAFGGGLTDNVFGSQTTHVLARFTTWMGVAFFSITLLLSILTARASAGKTAVQEKLLSAPAPVVTTPAVIEATPEPTPAPAAAPAQQETPVPAVETSVPAVQAPALQEGTDQASSSGLEAATDTAQAVTNEAAPATPVPEAPVSTPN